MSWLFRPGIGDFIARRPWIAGIEHQRGLAGDPGGAGNRRDDSLVIADNCFGFNLPTKAAFDDGSADEAIAGFHQALGMKHGHQGGTARAGRRAVELAGFHYAGVAAGKRAIDALQRPGHEAEGKMVPVWQSWMGKTQLRVGRRGNWVFPIQLCQTEIIFLFAS